MANKKPKSGTGKKKLALKKGTVRDLTTRRDATDAIRGGAVRKACMSCGNSCTSD